MNKSDSTVIDTRTIRQPIEQVDKAVIDELLAKVQEGRYWTIDEGDPLYLPPVTTLIVPASTVRDPDRVREFGEEFLLGDIYNLDGRRIPLEERPKGWLEQQEEIRKPGPNVYDENAVHRLGDDYLVVGRGRMFLAGETTIDGERAFEAVNTDEYMARYREMKEQEHRAFLDANPIIEESQPWWATDISLEQGDNLGETSINYTYSIEVDDLFLQQSATLKAGKLTLDKVELQNGYNSIPVTKWATVAGDLRGLAFALDRLAGEGR